MPFRARAKKERKRLTMSFVFLIIVSRMRKRECKKGGREREGETQKGLYGNLMVGGGGLFYSCSEEWAFNEPRERRSCIDVMGIEIMLS